MERIAQRVEAFCRRFQLQLPVLLAPTVSGSLLTAWRLAGAAWAKVQVINVPIEYGSSS